MIKIKPNTRNIEYYIESKLQVELIIVSKIVLDATS